MAALSQDVKILLGTFGATGMVGFWFNMVCSPSTLSELVAQQRVFVLLELACKVHRFEIGVAPRGLIGVGCVAIRTVINLAGSFCGTSLDAGDSTPSAE